MRRQAAAQQHLVFECDASLQLRVIALEQPPHRHLLEVHVSARLLGLWTASAVFENADRIAAHNRNERMFEPAQSARHYVAAAISWHLAPLSATIANHLQAQHLPEVAGERRVEAEPTDKLAESLPVRDRVELEPRRHHSLQGDRARQSVASDRSGLPGQIL